MQCSMEFPLKMKEESSTYTFVMDVHYKTMSPSQGDIIQIDKIRPMKI
jgi:hypothetical protein